MNSLPAFKRVVTGHDDIGAAVVSLCGPTPNVFALDAVPGTSFHEIWNTAETPAMIDSGADPTDRPLVLSPPLTGSLIRVVDIPPDSGHAELSDEQAAAVFSEIGEVAAGTGKRGSRHKLMHRTQTLDYGIVTEGEIWLVLDDCEVKLERGDIVIQRGTNHAWSNRTDAMARMVFILLDGRFSAELGGVR